MYICMYVYQLVHNLALFNLSLLFIEEENVFFSKIFPFIMLEQEHHIEGRDDFGTKRASQSEVFCRFQIRTGGHA